MSVVCKCMKIRSDTSRLLLQFTDLNKQDQLAKLSEARASTTSGPLKKFKFVSAVNEQVRPEPYALERVFLCRRSPHGFLLSCLDGSTHTFAQSFSAPYKVQ